MQNSNHSQFFLAIKPVFNNEILPNSPINVDVSFLYLVTLGWVPVLEKDYMGLLSGVGDIAGVLNEVNWITIAREIPLTLIPR